MKNAPIKIWLNPPSDLPDGREADMHEDDVYDKTTWDTTPSIGAVEYVRSAPDRWSEYSFEQMKFELEVQLNAAKKKLDLFNATMHAAGLKGKEIPRELMEDFMTGDWSDIARLEIGLGMPIMGILSNKTKA